MEKYLLVALICSFSEVSCIKNQQHLLAGSLFS